MADALLRHPANPTAYIVAHTIQDNDNVSCGVQQCRREIPGWYYGAAVCCKLCVCMCDYPLFYTIIFVVPFLLGFFWQLFICVVSTENTNPAKQLRRPTEHTELYRTKQFRCIAVL